MGGSIYTFHTFFSHSYDLLSPLTDLLPLLDLVDESPAQSPLPALVILNVMLVDNRQDPLEFRKKTKPFCLGANGIGFRIDALCCDAPIVSIHDIIECGKNNLFSITKITTLTSPKKILLIKSQTVCDALMILSVSLPPALMFGLGGIEMKKMPTHDAIQEREWIGRRIGATRSSLNEFVLDLLHRLIKVINIAPILPGLFGE